MNKAENTLKIGDKVGVITDFTDDGICYFMGYGKYMDEEIPHQKAKGPLVDVARIAKKKVPKIKLNNGDIVYGCEVWWGQKESVMAVVAAARKVVKVTLADIRWKESCNGRQKENQKESR